jgi:two-component system sensor histidine kinase KdpD
VGDRNEVDQQPGRPSRTATGLLAAGAILPALTAVLHPWRDTLALQTVLLLYLLAVVVVAVAGTSASAGAAALLAFLLVNWFYVPPYHTLAIGRRDNLVALVVFVAVAVITGVLVDVAGRRRAEATRAELQRDTMADFTRIPLDEADAAAVLAHIRRTFGLPWAALEDADRRPLLASGTRPDDGSLIRVPAGNQGTVLVAASPPTLALDRTSLAQLAAVAERARQAEELVAGATRLEQTERARVALLSAVGHDLRTPLSGIKAAVSVLRSPDARFSPQEEGQLLADIESGTDRLDDLVANLLDLSRLQTGALVVHAQPVRADEVAAAALLDASPGRVALDVPEDLPPLLADPVLLERVLANLVANALTHAGGSPVEVRGGLGTDTDGSTVVRLSVVDHGPGVAPERRAEMLVPFRRVDDSRTGGLGLGMAVVSGFCEAMGVELNLLGTEGGGLTVELTVPVVQGEPR